MIFNLFRDKYQMRSSGTLNRNIFQCLHIDIPLLLMLLALASIGFVTLYSAGNEHMNLVKEQAFHLALAFGLMFIVAQISPYTYQRWAPLIYFATIVLLLAVLAMGHINKGAQRWINLGFIHFQPSEIMKLAIPMVLAWRFQFTTLPPSFREVIISGLLILIPALLTAKQPDLGTAILLVSAGFFTLLLAGLNWRWIIYGAGTLIISAPILWHFMHSYQKERVLIFLDPERAPLAAGYHIIQSKIAIGSGGFWGKGWLDGTQSHLNYLPEHTTDFIFSVFNEELGLIGATLLIALYAGIVLRGLYIAIHAQNTFCRLLAGSISLTFFMSFFINMGMVSGIIPVVGVPLPLISYGGTSMVTMLINFGILMSIQTHRKLLGT